MASDDMSLFLRARPGCYFRVGISPTGDRRVPHHAPEFEMNEDGLPVGLRVALSVRLGGQVLKSSICPVEMLESKT